jgi:hypothetical protein
MLQFHLNMTQTPVPGSGPGSDTSSASPGTPMFYCPQCAVEVHDPLTCGDCAALICRRCGSPLESPDELGIG